MYHSIWQAKCFKINRLVQTTLPRKSTILNGKSRETTIPTIGVSTDQPLVSNYRQSITQVKFWLLKIWLLLLVQSTRFKFRLIRSRSAKATSRWVLHTRFRQHHQDQRANKLGCRTRSHPLQHWVTNQMLILRSARSRRTQHRVAMTRRRSAPAKFNEGTRPRHLTSKRISWQSCRKRLNEVRSWTKLGTRHRRPSWVSFKKFIRQQFWRRTKPWGAHSTETIMRNLWQIKQKRNLWSARTTRGWLTRWSNSNFSWSRHRANIISLSCSPLGELVMWFRELSKISMIPSSN